MHGSGGSLREGCLCQPAKRNYRSSAWLRLTSTLLRNLFDVLLRQGKTSERHRMSLTMPKRYGEIGFVWGYRGSPTFHPPAATASHQEMMGQTRKSAPAASVGWTQGRTLVGRPLPREGSLVRLPLSSRPATHCSQTWRQSANLKFSFNNSSAVPAATSDAAHLPRRLRCRQEHSEVPSRRRPRQARAASPTTACAVNGPRALPRSGRCGNEETPISSSENRHRGLISGQILWKSL